MPAPGAVKFGRLHYPGKLSEWIDQAVITYFKSPKSYTGEDVVEISLHGSPVAVSETLIALYETGARAALPGEFTYRAFLNGRIELTQAEAVADLIAARSKEAAHRALLQLDGSLGDSAKSISDGLASLLAYIELELDFVEEDSPFLDRLEKLNIIEDIGRNIEIISSGYRQARKLREGVSVVIVGPPNVGKSSIYNALIGENKAIVHQDPGTTRDVLTESCLIKGIEFRLFDTAGIRETTSEIEEEAVARATAAASTAEIILSVASTDVNQLGEDWEVSGDGRILRVMNKSDLGHRAVDVDYLPVSAKYGTAIDVLKQLLYNRVTGGESMSDASINRERHYQAISETRHALESARKSVESEMPAEIVAEELREALRSMDELTGRGALESVLENVFSSFCIGK